MLIVAAWGLSRYRSVKYFHTTNERVFFVSLDIGVLFFQSEDTSMWSFRPKGWVVLDPIRSDRWLPHCAYYGQPDALPSVSVLVPLWCVLLPLALLTAFLTYRDRQWPAAQDQSREAEPAAKFSTARANDAEDRAKEHRRDRHRVGRPAKRSRLPRGLSFAAAALAYIQVLILLATRGAAVVEAITELDPISEYVWSSTDDTPGVLLIGLLVAYFGLVIFLPYLPARWIYMRLRWKRVRFEALHCRNCGYNLTGNVTGVCSECGEAAPDPADRQV